MKMYVIIASNFIFKTLLYIGFSNTMHAAIILNIEILSRYFETLNLFHAYLQNFDMDTDSTCKSSVSISKALSNYLLIIQNIRKKDVL